jgi:hypothetical protein
LLPDSLVGPFVLIDDNRPHINTPLSTASFFGASKLARTLPPSSSTDCSDKTVNMGAKDVLTRKTGVIVGDDVLNLFKYAKEKGFAIPAIVSDSSFFGFLSPDRSRTSPHHRPW